MECYRSGSVRSSIELKWPKSHGFSIASAVSHAGKIALRALQGKTVSRSLDSPLSLGVPSARTEEGYTDFQPKAS
eukprot:799506-Amphidinium_carterae.1